MENGYMEEICDSLGRIMGVLRICSCKLPSCEVSLGHICLLGIEFIGIYCIGTFIECSIEELRSEGSKL